MTTMTKIRIAVLALITAATPIALVAGGGVARARGAEPGDSCTVLHAQTMGPDGRWMWCNPTMTGSHSLVWQYGGPA
jgi:hypothetical protein